MSVLTTSKVINYFLDEQNQREFESNFSDPLCEEIRSLDLLVSQVFSRIAPLGKVSAFVFEMEINAMSLAGRTMITFIFPSKDWITFIGATQETRRGCRFQGCHLEDETLMSASKYIRSFVESFSEEMFLEDGALTIA